MALEIGPLDDWSPVDSDLRVIRDNHKREIDRLIEAARDEYERAEAKQDVWGAFRALRKTDGHIRLELSYARHDDNDSFALIQTMFRRLAAAVMAVDSSLSDTRAKVESIRAIRTIALSIIVGAAAIVVAAIVLSSLHLPAAK